MIFFFLVSLVGLFIFSLCFDGFVDLLEGHFIWGCAFSLYFCGSWHTFCLASSFVVLEDFSLNMKTCYLAFE